MLISVHAAVSAQSEKTDEWTAVNSEWVAYKLPPGWDILKLRSNGPIYGSNKSNLRFASYIELLGQENKGEITIEFGKHMPVEMDNLTVEDLKFWLSVWPKISSNEWSEAPDINGIKAIQFLVTEYIHQGHLFSNNCKRLIYLRKVGANVYSMIVTIPFAKITPELEKDIEAVYKSWKVKN